MLRAVLSRYDFALGEYGNEITYNIYDESEAVYTLTGYTVTMELLSDDSVILSVIATITPTKTFTFTQTNTTSQKGIHRVRFKLEKAGVLQYTKSVKVVVV